MSLTKSQLEARLFEMMAKTGELKKVAESLGSPVLCTNARESLVKQAQEKIESLDIIIGETIMNLNEDDSNAENAQE